MARDDRRRTFATNNPRNTSYDGAAHNGERGRRQTTDNPAIRRTTNNTHRQSLRIEKPRDEPKPNPTKLKDYHEVIQGQLQAYKKKLSSDLEHDLSTADNELHDGMNDLAEKFEVKCSVIDGAGQVFRDHIANEVLEVDNEKIVLDEHMEEFKRVYQQKEAKLRGLWKEYVDVQKQIMELAIVVLDDADVGIINPDAVEEDATQEQTVGRDPEIDEDAAAARQKTSRELYQSALDAVDGLRAEVDDTTTEALDRNKEILKEFEVGQKKLKQKIAGFLDSVQDL